MVLLHCGVGKNWAGPLFPPSKMLGSFYLSSRLLDYVILLLYLNSLDLYQAENQVFKPSSLFVIVGWGKTGPAHSFPLLNLSIFYWSFRLSDYVTLSLYFNIYERPIPKWESSFQSNKIIGTSTLLGGERLDGHSFPPPKSFDLSIDQLVFQFMLLFHCILTLLKYWFQRENQVFKPNILFVLLHCGVGKDWAGPFFPPPSKMFWSFYLSFSL